MSIQIKSLSDFQVIERELLVEKISFLGIPAWGAMRVYLYYAALNLKSVERPSITWQNAVKSLFRQWWRIFQRHKYWVLTSSDQRKEIDGRWVNALDSNDDLNNNALFIELPNPTLKPNPKSKKVVARIWFYLFEELMGRLVTPFVSDTGQKEYDEVCAKLNLSANFLSFKRKFVGQFYATYFMAKWQKPRIVFLTTHYTNMPRIAALKSLKIPVVEIQHGLMSVSHPGYNPIKCDPKLYPDVILTYGETELSMLKQSEMKDDVQFAAIGHFYIDHLRMANLSESGIPKKEKRLRICFTAQDAVGVEFIDWLNELQQLLPDVELVLIPRMKPFKWYIENGLKAGISYFKADTYHIIRESDIHSTVYSTCAVEALAFNVPNILLNLGEQAEQHFGNLRFPATPTWIVNSPAEFVEVLSSAKFKDRAHVANGEVFFKSGFKQNLDQFLLDREV